MDPHHNRKDTQLFVDFLEPKLARSRNLGSAPVLSYQDPSSMLYNSHPLASAIFNSQTSLLPVPVSIFWRRHFGPPPPFQNPGSAPGLSAGFMPIGIGHF